MASTPAFNHEGRTIVITEQNLKRLKHLLDSAKVFRHDCHYIDSLDEELDAAKIVVAERLPDDIVTIGTQVRITDLATKKQMTYTVVFPRDANFADRISVLAPVGAALLGAKAGDVVKLTVPGGQKRLRIDAVVPTAAAAAHAA